jgi:hypothetical protein
VIKEFYGERRGGVVVDSINASFVGVDLLGKYVIAQRTGEGKEEII